MNPLNRLQWRGRIVVNSYTGPLEIERGTPLIIARFCNDSPVGNKGRVHGWRITSKGIRVTLDFGRNLSGQPLRKTYPANVLAAA